MIGLLAVLLLSLTGRRRAPNGGAATAAAPPPARQKYFIQNIVIQGTPSADLSLLRSKFLHEIESRFGELAVEIENRTWLDTEKCKPGQNCDLITIDVDNRQLLLRCTERRGVWSLPERRSKCPSSRDRCMWNLPEQLPDTLWTHDEIHRIKNR
jgi:hypothetical protein